MNRIIFYTITTLLALTMLTACGTLPHEAKTSTKKETVQEPIKESEKLEQNKRKAQKHARRLLKEEDYIGTIDLIKKEIRNGIDERDLAKEYLQAAHGALMRADTLMKQRQYAKAAHLYEAVQDSSPPSQELRQQVALPPEQLAKKIDVCTEKLMEEGLLAYRSGELSQAIEIWQQILEFNPQYQAAQDSIETAQQQLSNLKSIDKKD